MTNWRHGAAFGIGAALVAIALLVPVGPSGDSIEYVALARQIAHHARVSFTPDEAAAANVWEPRFVGWDGRQDLWHFWLYPALVAPTVRIADRFGVDVHRAFALVNALTLAGLAATLIPRIGMCWALVFVASPIIWWVPRAQVEVFTFTGIALGCALFMSRPAPAALAFAIAGTQNPPLAVPAVLAAVRAVVARPRRMADFVFLALAVCFAALHPAYYLWHLGRPTPLVAAAQWRWPNGRAMLSPLLDLNFGLLWCAPIAAAVLVWSVARHSPVSLRLFLVTCAAVFLVSFAQAPNVNHGGTPSLSRYALWLIPLPLVSLAALPSRSSPMVPMTTAATILWTALFFWPAMPESHLRPSRLASWVWETHPAWNNPLPEVFAERMRHREEAYSVAATPNCAKVLVTEGTWPSSCAAVPVPEGCAAAGAICYGNRRGDGAYDFVIVPRR